MHHIRRTFSRLPRRLPCISKIQAGYSTNSGSGANPPSISNPPLVDSKTGYHTQTKRLTEEELPEIMRIPLSEPVPWLPEPVYATVSDKDNSTIVTTLDNGIKVASEPKFGRFCSLGIIFDSGSRYEVAYPGGISHFIQKLAFSSTTNMTKEKVSKIFVEELGGINDCQTTRDAAIYATSFESRHLEKSLEVLSEVTWRPTHCTEDFEMARQSVSFDLENFQLQPQNEMSLMDMIHSAAFRDNTLGLPKICPAENVSIIQPSHVNSFMSQYHTPERTVVAGIGIADHDELVRAVEKYFVTGSAVWDSNKQILDSVKGIDRSMAQYTGGEVLVNADMSAMSLTPTPIPELCHVALGFPSVPHQHPDFVATCVLNVLLGGGGSFSEGGPGKGMYARFYTHVLNRHHWIVNAVAMNQSYSDSGLFCILLAAHPHYSGQLVEVIVRELLNVTETISVEEFMRAKTQLKSLVLMNLEARPGILEDMLRQVLATGVKRSCSYYMNAIDQVTIEDIKRVTRDMVQSKLALAALGSLDHLPKRIDVETAFNNGVPLKSMSAMKRIFPFIR